MEKKQGNARQYHAYEPPHGKILGYYAIIYDRHIRREIIIPASRLDILKGTVRIP